MSANTQYLFGDRAVSIVVQDLLAVAAEAVVIAADPELTLAGGLGQRVLERAGTDLARDSAQLLREYGAFEPGMAAQTGAGRLPFRAVIHAVLPAADDGFAARVIEQAVARCLLICETNDWSCLALPPLGLEIPGLGLRASAHALQRAISQHWDARVDSAVASVVICLEESQFAEFDAEFAACGRAEDAGTAPAAGRDSAATPAPRDDYGEVNVEDLRDGGDDAAIDDWFK